MPSTPPSGAPVISVAQRAFPWLILIAVLAAGVALCFTLGPHVVPFFLGGPR